MGSKTAASAFAYQGSIGRNRTTSSGDARFSFLGYGAMLPDAENRITLDPGRRDAWGIPVPHIRCKIGEQDKITLQKQIDALVETVEDVGGKIKYVGSPLGLVERGAWRLPQCRPVQPIDLPKDVRKINGHGRGHPRGRWRAHG